MNPKLSILIPSTIDRLAMTHQLCDQIEKTLNKKRLKEAVEIIVEIDNKEMSIGEKRQRLYDEANGLYSWQIDSDDNIAEDAIVKIIGAMSSDPDCITFEELCVIDGVVKRSNFSLKYADWGENQDGYDYVRTPFFKTPIKTGLCRQVEIPHIRFGEDHIFAQRIKPLLKTEVHIPEQLYLYLHTSSPFNERYGITE